METWGLLIGGDLAIPDCPAHGKLQPVLGSVDNVALVIPHSCRINPKGDGTVLVAGVLDILVNLPLCKNATYGDGFSSAD